jgi:hypothetical protein
MNMLLRSNVIFEIRTELRGSSHIDGIYKDQREALARADALIGQIKYEAVRIFAVDPSLREKMIFEKITSIAEAPIRIMPADDVITLSSSSDLYSFRFRLMLGRILRNYLDRENIPVIELIHNRERLTRLTKDHKVYTQVISQLKKVLEPSDTLKKQGDGLAERLLTDVLKQTNDFESFLPAATALDHGGITGLLQFIETAPESKRSILLTFALAKRLSTVTSWTQKIETIISLFGESISENGLHLLDEALAELLDGATAIKEIMGAATDLSEVLDVLVGLLGIDLRLAAPRTAAVVPRIRAISRTQQLPATEEIVLRRILKTLDGSMRLTNFGRDAEETVLRRLIIGLCDSVGCRGGGSMALALIKRARSVLGNGIEDLSFDEAVNEVCSLLPNKSSVISLIISLKGAPTITEGQSSFLLKKLAEIFLQTRNLSDLFGDTLEKSEKEQLVQQLAITLAASALPVDLSRNLLLRLESFVKQGKY